MAYEPFLRGPFPVGVDTITLRHADRDRPPAFELWYPAVSSSTGLDLRAESQDRFRIAPAAPELRQSAVRDAVPRLGSFPLVVFAHPGAGHRRTGAPLCTHVASHGYVVAAADHSGPLGAWPAELSLIIDELGAGRGGPGGSYLDLERVAVTGAGLGGWAALAAVAADARIAVAAVLDPAVADAETRGQPLDTSWPRLVPTLIAAAEAALEDSRALAGQLHTPWRLLAIRDDPEGEAVRTVVLAHLDAHLRDLGEARDLLAGELDSWLDRSGVHARWVV